MRRQKPCEYGLLAIKISLESVVTLEKALAKLTSAFTVEDDLYNPSLNKQQEYLCWKLNNVLLDMGAEATCYLTTYIKRPTKQKQAKH